MRIQDCTVLIVDDVNAIRVQIKELLKSYGFELIIMAANGAEAKDALEKNEVNFILCDWHMSPIDGIELLKWVRAHDRYKTTPFVMVTAEKTKEGVMKAIQSGVDDYLVKPMTKEQVQNKVFTLLTKKKVLL